MNSPSRGERIDAPLHQSGLQSRLFNFFPASTAEGCGLRLVLAGCSPRSSWSCASTASVTTLICLGLASRKDRQVGVPAAPHGQRCSRSDLLPPCMAALTALNQKDCFLWESCRSKSKSNSSKKRLDSGKSAGSRSASRSISSNTLFCA